VYLFCVSFAGFGLGLEGAGLGPCYMVFALLVLIARLRQHSQFNEEAALLYSVSFCGSFSTPLLGIAEK